MSPSFARVRAALIALGLRVRETGRGLEAQCPAHEDRHPSLSVSEGEDGRVLLFCHAGCAFESVVRALDLNTSDAFLGRDESRDRVRLPRRADRADQAEKLWERMGVRDGEGEGYLGRRGLLVEPLPSDVIRFNRGGTGNAFVDFAASKGFRVVFAVRNPSGTVASLSFRHAGNGADWNGVTRTKLCLKGHSTSGVAIVRPEATFLSGSDAELQRDEVILCEGGTDWLAATIANDIGAIEGRVPPAWVVGCIGVSSAPSVVKAFAPLVAGRVLRIWFDRDDAGQRASEVAGGIAVEVGARSVHRLLPNGKDVADDLARSA